jgi:hypothetical protein
MATINKVTLSNSAGGRPILITGTTSGSPTNIHTTGTNASVYDELWLYANNFSNSYVNITVQFGGTSANATNNDQLWYNVPSQSGLTLITPGLVLNGDGSAGRQVSAFTSTTNLVSVTGFVNRIS